MNLLVLLIIVPIIVALLLTLNWLFAVNRPDAEKVTPYECGFNPIHGQVRSPFTVQYYLIGLLFLIFDLEIAVFYPLAVTLYQISLYGFCIGLLFLVLLTFGFIYELGKGALLTVYSNAKD